MVGLMGAQSACKLARREGRDRTKGVLTMHAKVIGLVIIAFSLSPAPGQSLLQPSQARVLQFAHTQTVQSAQEIAAVIRMIAGIAQVSLSTEPTPFTLTIGG